MAKQIGLFGFGVVGQGYYEIAQKHQKGLLPTTIVVQNEKKKRGHDIPFSFNPNDILENNTDIAVELISDPQEAFTYVQTLLKKGAKVISANKKMLAANLPQLIQLEREYGGSLLYEASAAAGIPVITTLDTQFAGDQIRSLEGILNGSSNYILTRLFEDGLSFKEALKLAQENGFAETDPTLDINGSDVSSKLTILTLHAFGKYIKEENIATLGIQHIRKDDVELANSFRLKIKLVAKVTQTPKGPSAYILPALVDPLNSLFTVDNEYNAIKVQSANLGEQFYKGKGAGSFPTGASVYGDLCKIERGYAYGYEKLQGEVPTDIFPEASIIEVLIRSKNQDAVQELAPKAGTMFKNGCYWACSQLPTDRLIECKELIEENEISIIAINQTISIEELRKHLETALSATVN